MDKRGQNVDKSVYNSQECGYTEVLVRFVHRKTHQIRVAFSHIGHPLVGIPYMVHIQRDSRSNCVLKGCIYTHAHRRAYYGYRIISSN